MAVDGGGSEGVREGGREEGRMGLPPSTVEQEEGGRDELLSLLTALKMRKREGGRGGGKEGTPARIKRDLFFALPPSPTHSAPLCPLSIPFLPLRK